MIIPVTIHVLYLSCGTEKNDAKLLEALLNLPGYSKVEDEDAPYGSAASRRILHAYNFGTACEAIQKLLNLMPRLQRIASRYP